MSTPGPRDEGRTIMRSDTLHRSLLAALFLGGWACVSGGPGTADGTGGSAAGGRGAGGGASGGTGAGGSAVGGMTGQAGNVGFGGAGSGGIAGTGGAAGGGGRLGTGGRVGPGGASGTGGATAGTGGGGGSYVGSKSPGTAQAGDITVNPATIYQAMDGFGIADVWQSKNNSTQQLLTLLFDPVAGIGLTLLRIGIDGSTGRIMGDAAFVDGPAIAKSGGKIWAAPWTPPANLNNNVNNGGHLVASNYDAWSSTLAAFPAYYKQQSGVDLWGLSAQNEPDFVASYQSCIYSAAQMNAFIKVLGPKLKALNPPVHLLAAEPDVWSHTWSNGDRYGSAIIGDPTVSALVDIIATHDYGSNVSSTTRPAPPAGVTQHIWQTEITYTAGAAIGPGLDIARGIYAAVTSGGVSGWLYWWTQQFLDGGSATNPPKRVYAMGNFSKFVRPGYLRVGITGVRSSVQIVPFYGAGDGTTVIVALNSGTSAVQAPFFVSGTAWPDMVTPYVTSASSNLVAGTPIAVSGARFSASLAAQSVTTFVGKP
jgi:glucuronoarabinoxylan endo-1,4-beta-xylanase